MSCKAVSTCLRCILTNRTSVHNALAVFIQRSSAEEPSSRFGKRPKLKRERAQGASSESSGTPDLGDDEPDAGTGDTKWSLLLSILKLASHHSTSMVGSYNHHDNSKNLLDLLDTLPATPPRCSPPGSTKLKSISATNSHTHMFPGCFRSSDCDEVLRRVRNSTNARFY